METAETQSLVNDLESYFTLFIHQLPQIGVGLVLLITFYYLAGPISKFLIKPLNYAHTSELIRLVSRRIVSLLIILFGFYLFLRLAGLSDFAVAILSGTGVVGLIIGFAFKDIAENFMSSLLLSVQKPFRLGEVIEVSGQLGVVKQVTARATTLVDFDGNHIQIPNSTVYKNIIRNFTANPLSRGHFIIGIGYDAEPELAQKIGLSLLAETEAVLNEPEPQILVNELGSSTMNLKVYFWTNTSQYSLLKVSSMLMRTMVKAFDDAGISMPDDARELIFPEGININQMDNSNANDTSNKPEQKRLNAGNESEKAKEMSQAFVDLSSDDGDIRKQASLARDPESGANIL